MQVAPGGHVVPHPPQLSASFPFVITHEPLGHCVVPGAQVDPQTPALQTSPGWQGMLQPAQFWASDEMQAPLQLSNPAWHWHDPF